MKKIFSKKIEVRFRDLDAMGHVNNAVFFTYFEEGRKAFFREFSKKGDTSFPFILARIRCDFRRPIGLLDNIMLKLWVESIGTKSFTFKYRIVAADDESVIFADGDSVQVAYDYSLGRSVEVPPPLVEHLKRYKAEV